ncbi:engulfment and motility protein [Volvox carteri f. nagariensis]|uniref:Engulfment and motility protein n=1 Tax=Volvox carteri f. nagariensis TaxID=3068 RepID=D8TJ10_VOLCA|nr:engulfment and motility protein [Volvox carteri f. nagariensis]EFJ52460.1 engulfment and motility protein [Volvox carteri f. nagariensis]|eukprot:XP_002946533.1 engulfment and motility protein [Volvox carteri f. nagariensis]
MAGLRRRRQGKDEDGLTESLLPDYDEQHEQRLEANRTAIIVHPGEFNFQAFIQSILDWWNRLFGSLLAYATAFWPHGSAWQAWGQPISLLQAERLQLLRERVAEKFNIANSNHQDALRRLWSLAFSGEPCTALKSAKWKEMGWQGDDPATDFRGAGMYGLDNLIYLAEVHPETFRRLVDKTEGTRAEWEYPFAVAGLNITFMLSELLELHTAQGTSSDAGPHTAAGRGFVALLEQSDVAFEELYCATYCLLDATWLQMRASYMEFNTVMKRVRAEVERALSSRPPNMQMLRKKLLGTDAPLDLN